MVEARYPASDQMSHLSNQIDKMAELKPDWDSYGAEPPSAEVLAKIKASLPLVESILPITRVVPSAQGGAAFVWAVANTTKYADIEFLNTGETLACTTDGSSQDGIEVWEVDDLDTTVNRIKDFLLPMACGHHTNYEVRYTEVTRSGTHRSVSLCIACNYASVTKVLGAPAKNDELPSAEKFWNTYWKDHMDEFRKLSPLNSHPFPYAEAYAQLVLEHFIRWQMINTGLIQKSGAPGRD